MFLPEPIDQTDVCKNARNSRKHVGKSILLRLIGTPIPSILLPQKFLST
jgi:hypothetical protein